MNDRTAIIRYRLENGFRTDAGRLKELGRDFFATLESARRLVPPNTTDEWQANWNQRWDAVERLLQRISDQFIEIEGHIERDDQEKLMEALVTWDTVQPEEAELERALAAARSHALELGDEAQRDWNTVDSLIRTHLETLKATAVALRVKLQLLKQYPKSEVDHIVREVLARLPQHLQHDFAATEDYLRQYRQAAIDIEKEQHQQGDFLDTLKAMFLWVDTPEERLRAKPGPKAVHH
jgi:tRNA-dihydrouridine synthase